MKKYILILVTTVIATTAYNQTSRRSTNVNGNTKVRTSSANKVYASNTNSRSEFRSTPRVASNHRHSASRRTTHIRSTDRNMHHTHSKVHSKKYYHTTHYHYRAPKHVRIVWTRDMHRHYVRLYPHHSHWNYSYGYRISSVPSYKAKYFVGDVKNVYGKITNVEYIPQTDEYLLYFGQYYPYQHLTIVVPGFIAREKTRRPTSYFMNQYINTTGLITSFEGKPEIIVKQNCQINVY